MPELPKDKRPCLICGKPGHIARDCPGKPAMAVEPSAEAGGSKPAYAMVCRAETGRQEQDKPRGRPFEKTFDEEGFEVVQGGYRPVPRQVVLGDFPIRTKHEQGKTKFMPFSKCADIICDCEHTDRTTSVTESRVDLPHPAGDGRQGPKNQDHDSTRPGPHCRNSETAPPRDETSAVGASEKKKHLTTTISKQIFQVVFFNFL